MTVMRLVSSSKLIKLLLLAGVATALIAVPAAIDGRDPGIGWQTALAKDDGGNGGGGGKGGGGGQGKGQGGDHGRGAGAGKGNGVWHGNGHRGANSPDTATYGSFGEFVDKVQNRKGQGAQAGGHQITKASSAAGFKNHGERTRTMVELAKRLGYGAQVGAHQANLGTPFENGIADLQAQLAAAREAKNTRPSRTSNKSSRKPSRTRSLARGRMTPGRRPISMSIMTVSSTTATSTL